MSNATLLTPAGFDRFLLDRLCLDGEVPLRCEVGRVRAALGRVANCFKPLYHLLKTEDLV